MKTKFIILISFLLFLISKTVIAQTSGGPDGYGYIWRSNLDPLGQAYDWKDVRTSGTKIAGLRDDNVIGPYHLNFSFNYYGNNYDSIWVGANGFIAFQYGVNLASPLPVIPTTGGLNNNFVAPMLSDLTFANASNNYIPKASAYFYSNNVDTFIVQWDSVPFWSNVATPLYPDTVRNSFQAIFYAKQGTITFQYKLQKGKSPSTGNAIVTGMENGTGQIGLQVSLNSYPLPNSSIQILNPTFSTNDLENNVFTLGQNFPNPVISSTSISYTMSSRGNVRMLVRNMIGEEIESLNLGNQSSGNHSVNLNTSKFSQGLYFYTLKIGNKEVTRKMIVVK